jgi:DNA-binding FrmR family transcriptional regulator
MSDLKQHIHVHDPSEKKRQINRLSRVIGHLEYIKRMIANDEDCAAVLMQIAATRSALNGLGKSIINEHISHCIAHAVEEGDMEAIEEFKKAIEKYI